jgi:hypothetical protein
MELMEGRAKEITVSGALEARTVAISWQFNSHELSETLLVYATMGRKPGVRLMRLMERRAEEISGEFNSQHVSDTLWAYATMGRSRGSG